MQARARAADPSLVDSRLSALFHGLHARSRLRPPEAVARIVAAVVLDASGTRALDVDDADSLRPLDAAFARLEAALPAVRLNC